MRRTPLASAQLLPATQAALEGGVADPRVEGVLWVGSRLYHPSQGLARALHAMH